MKVLLPVFISALLMGIAQHPMHLGFLAWFALIPLFYCLNRVNSWSDIFIFGFIWGFTYNFSTIFWLALNIGTSRPIAFISMIASIIILTINIIIIFSIWYIIKIRFKTNSLLLLPFIWTFIEYWRSYGTLGFPWVSIANTQIEYLTLIQNAEYLGIYGICFWIVAVNVAFFKLIKRKNTKYQLLTTLLFILPWITGMAIFPEIKRNGEDGLSIASIQPNVKLKQKWQGSIQDNLNHLLNLSQSAIDRDINLIIWPESALPVYLLQSGKQYLKRIKESLGNHSTLITGIPYADFSNNNKNIYNSAVSINNKGVQDIYHKMQLVPMAEYVPWSKTISILGNFNLGQGNFSKGNNIVMFKKNKIQFGTVICFESTFPWIFRDYAQQGAELMIIVTNDGWYETPPEPQQHAKQSIYRAIETRRPIIRCANTGISMVIDQSGNILKELGLNEKGVIEATIFPEKRMTFYTKYGDKFSQFTGFITLLYVVLAILKRKNEN